MDIEKVKRLSKKASEAGELVKAVTAFKNELKDKEKMRDVIMSDHFKTLREPLIEQQKKTDEKQDKVIEQLQKNQKALTSGIQDIMTLNRELPQIAPEELPAPKEKKVYSVDVRKRFDEQELEIIEDLGLKPPDELFNLDINQLLKEQEDVKKKGKRDYTCNNWFKKYKEKRCQPRIKGKRKREKST